MRTAVLLYGHTRTFKQCAESLFEFFIKPLNSDVFIHTWDVCESVTPSWHNEHKSSIERIDYDQIDKTYNPVDCIIETQPAYVPGEDTIVSDNISLFGYTRMFESLFKSNELKSKYELSNNFAYDLVLKIRPDILLKTALDTNMFIPKITDGQFLYGSNNQRAIDIINLCTSKTMNDVCDFYNNIKIHTRSERMFESYLRSLSVEMINIGFEYNRNWTIMRENDV